MNKQLLDLSIADVQSRLKAWGQPGFRARQIHEWIYQHRVDQFSQMTNLSKELRSLMEEAWVISAMDVVERQISKKKDAEKYLIRLEDGQHVESVLMRYRYGNSLCLSTQVGCAFGCSFCVSGQGGWQRDLTVGEIVGQWLLVQRQLDASDERISHVVYMGIGEPLANYEATVESLHRLNDEDVAGISFRRMSVSTVGLIPEIRRLMHEQLPITLAVSLHAPNDYIRRQIMPKVTEQYPLQDLIAVTREYSDVTGRRVSLEYAMIKGINDHPELARELGVLLRGWSCHVNLIPLNEGSLRWEPSSPEVVDEFLSVLQMMGISATKRRPLGRDIEGACGQLRSRRGGD